MDNAALRNKQARYPEAIDQYEVRRRRKSGDSTSHHIERRLTNVHSIDLR